MTGKLRVMIETGPKDKRTVAIAPDWPGLARGAKTEETAIETLVSYIPRYSIVATTAGRGDEFAKSSTVEVVERYPGTGSTDFWGISFAFSSSDRQVMSGDELERELTLMRACWTFFDNTRSRVSEEMQRGPRGGGRDRELIVRHTFGAEREWAPKIGVNTPVGAMLTGEGLSVHRTAYSDAIRDLHAHGKMARTWPLRYLIRHTAFHTLDHAWEMEDKDRTARST